MYGTKPNDPLFVDDKLTPISELEAARILGEAWKTLYGNYPSVDSLALLWAQSALESGRWKSLHHYCFTNFKKQPGKKYTSFKCNEIIKGKEEWFVPYHPQTFFVAYDSALEGAIEYLKFLANRKRYAKAWAAVNKGDPALFSHELKAAGFYTAGEAGYTKGVVSLTNEFKRKIAPQLSWLQAPAKQESIPSIHDRETVVPSSSPTPTLTAEQQERYKPIISLIESVKSFFKK